MDDLTVTIKISVISCGNKTFDSNSGQCVAITTHVIPPILPPLIGTPRCLSPSCGEHQPFNFLVQVCFCDEQCELYRDCCHDAIPMNRSISKIYEHITCQQTNFELNVFTSIASYLMVSSCPSEWTSTQQDQKIAKGIFFKCSNSSLLPQTDPNTNFTFRNIYCAQCYNINLTNLVVWRAEYSCDINTTLDAKVLQLRSIEDVAKRCQLLKYMHEPSLARHCFPHVSTCSNQTNIDATRKCQTGELELYKGLNNVRLFRNSYCADCNGVGNANRTCLEVRPTPPVFVGPDG